MTAIVPSVTGAPGDGSASLTAAIQRELTNKGVSVADKPTTVAYRVEGTVTVGESKQGKQSIHIEWLVRDPQGKKLGTVSQRNEIPEGSLDGEWGPTATQAAGAAAQGIVKLLPQPKTPPISAQIGAGSAASRTGKRRNASFQAACVSQPVYKARRPLLEGAQM